VFKSEIDGLLMPSKHFVVRPLSARVSIDKLINQVEATYPKYLIGSWEIF